MQNVNRETLQSEYIASAAGWRQRSLVAQESHAASQGAINAENQRVEQTRLELAEQLAERAAKEDELARAAQMLQQQREALQEQARPQP